MEAKEHIEDINIQRRNKKLNKLGKMSYDFEGVNKYIL